MPTKVEKDALTGVTTTGHEWDGLKELNNPLPRWWLYVFYATIAFSLVWYLLYPSWPVLNGYWKGFLGSNQRLDLETGMAAARQRQAVWLDRLRAADTSAIVADPELLQFAVAGGGVAFKENCAPCHALGGAGQAFYPTLADDDWLWGGTLEDIELTVRHGIRNPTDADARSTQMPAFGTDGILGREEIADIAAYVASLSRAVPDQAAAERGAALFADNCAACHGEDGRGMKELGAPNLADAIWLYGDSLPEIEAQITRPRHGVMPSWQGRLDEETIKMLAVYVHSLGGGE
jgi:cytochrome c oxidase cbb3-type subunit 3